MFSRSVGAIAACALGASAFLIPADITDSASLPKALDANVGRANAKGLALKLPCSDCVFYNPQEEKAEDVNEDNWFHIQGSANSVVVNFTVSEDGERLEANGETIYPIGSAVTDMFKHPKYFVKQVAQSATLEDINNGEAESIDVQVTGHGVAIMNEDSVSEEGDKLIPIKYTIYEIEGQPVTIDDVTIHVLSTEVHGLLIVHSETTERPAPRPDDSFGTPPEDQLDSFSPGPPPEDFGKHKECKHLPAALCKLRNMIEDKFSGMRQGIRKGKGCHGRMGKFGAHHGPPHGHLPGHIRPHFHMDGEDAGPPRPHHGRPHHMRPHGHHGHHHHGFYHAFSRGLSAVLIPTMAGIAVGMAVSLIGLVVGRLIGFFWIRFYRGGRRGYAGVALDENAAQRVEAEKEFEVESARTSMESAPPLYEHAPAYEAVEKEVN